MTGSGAEVEVVIPSFGSGASVFTKGDKVGKIKKLKNNNFGYDYPHDYTLRPEITFPLNCQLTSTSILDSITVTDPGSGYSQAPAVIISGGGGSGATVTTSDAAPSSPSDGDLWWKSDDGRLKVYYQDADSSQWVDASPPLAATDPNIPAAVGLSKMNGNSPTWTGTSSYTVAKSRWRWNFVVEVIVF